MPHPILIATIMRPEGDTGVQTHFRSFLAWLTSQGLPCGLLSPYSSPRWQVYPVFALRRLVDPLHKTASVWWYRHWHSVLLFKALRAELGNGQPCVIYAQCPLSADAALRARMSPSQRVVMVVHFNISQADEWAEKGAIAEHGVLYQSIRRFEANVFPRLDGMVYVSDFMRRELNRRIPAITAVPYRVVPNFLRDPGVHKAVTSFDNDLICVGTLEPRKNQNYALEIIAAAKRLGRPLSLTLVGDGPDRRRLELLAGIMGIENEVRFVGYVNNAAKMMSRHRACLHVARIENLPLTLLEALSYSLPVFAPAVGGIPEVFQDGKEGRQIPLNDPDHAAKMIVEWLDSAPTMIQASTAARDRYLDCFEADKAASKLTRFLNLPL